MKNKAMLSSDFGFLPLPSSLLLSLCRFFVVDNAKARDFGRGCGVEKLAAYGEFAISDTEENTDNCLFWLP